MEDTLLLNQNEIKNLITMKDVVDVCDKTFKDMGENKTINPAKVGLDLGEKSTYPPYQGFMNAMPAYIGWLDVAGIKWAGGMLGKRKKLNLPYITSMTLLINPEIGNFIGALDGALITNYRTGAQTANALKYIKSNQKSIKLGLYGAGMQGRTQTMALSEVFDIEQLIVYDIYKESSEKFKNDMKNYVHGDIIVADNPEETPVNADVVVSVTQSNEQFLKEDWIEPGTVVFPMGSYQECEDSLLQNSDHIVVDHIEQALHRGALKGLHDSDKITDKDIFATISDLSIKEKEITSPESKKVICVPVGTGAMDIAVAKVVLDKAKEKNIGTTFDFVQYDK